MIYNHSIYGRFGKFVRNMTFLEAAHNKFSTDKAMNDDQRLPCCLCDGQLRKWIRKISNSFKRKVDGFV